MSTLWVELLPVTLSTAVFLIFLRPVCAILPPSPVCGYMFITLILLDYLPQAPAPTWRVCAAFLSGCFRLAQGKMEKHVVLKCQGVEHW